MGFEIEKNGDSVWKISHGWLENARTKHEGFIISLISDTGPTLGG